MVRHLLVLLPALAWATLAHAIRITFQMRVDDAVDAAVQHLRDRGFEQGACQRATGLPTT